MPLPLALCVLPLLAPSPLVAQDEAQASWPHWRGPGRDAISLETGWSVEGREAPLWSRNVGLGYSCVTIVDGRLFTLGFDEEAGLDRLFCLDPMTGEERWRHEWPTEILNNFHGGGTLTTPSIEGDRMYVSRRFGTVTCFEHTTGAVLWERDYATELELEQIFHGFSASPVLIDGRLFLVFGDLLVCCDPLTGEELWQVGGPGDGGYSNLTPFELGGRGLFAMFAGDGLVVYDRDDGEELWSYPWKPEGEGVNCCTPIIDGDRVFISSAYGMGAALLRLGEGPAPEVLWKTKTFRNKVSSCVLYEGHIYGFDESMLKCIDLEGKEQWRVRGLGMGTPALAGGKLLVLSSKGDLIIAAASPEGFDELARRKVLDGGVYWTPPVLLGGLIYCRNSLGDLVCLDHREAAGVAAASAEPGAAAGDAPDAEALFARHAALVGGEVLSARRSMHVEGEIEITGAGITRTPMHIRRMVPELWHLEYSLGQYGTVYRGFDGTVGWVLDPFYGKELMKDAALLEMKETLGFLSGVDWREAYTSFAAPVRAHFDDRDCWEVRAVTAGGTERSVYFDAETGLQAGRDASTEALVIYGDWRDFEGVKLPALTTRLIPDTGAEETYYVSKVTWDGVDAAVFALPEHVRRLMRSPEGIEAESVRVRELYAAFLGTYEHTTAAGEPELWRVQVGEGELTLSTPDRGSFALTRHSDEGRFDLPFPGVYVVFSAGEGGAVEKLTFHGPDGDRELPRILEDRGGDRFEERR